MQKSECSHYSEGMLAVEPRAEKCEVCGLNGPIRVCGDCGFVGCCESMNSHDTEHWKATGHAIIIRLPKNDASWVWCYEHNDYLK